MTMMNQQQQQHRVTPTNDHHGGNGSHFSTMVHATTPQPRVNTIGTAAAPATPTLHQEHQRETATSRKSNNDDDSKMPMSKRESTAEIASFLMALKHPTPPPTPPSTKKIQQQQQQQAPQLQPQSNAFRGQQGGRSTGNSAGMASTLDHLRGNRGSHLAHGHSRMSNNSSSSNSNTGNALQLRHLHRHQHQFNGTIASALLMNQRQQLPAWAAAAMGNGGSAVQHQQQQRRQDHVSQAIRTLTQHNRTSRNNINMGMNMSMNSNNGGVHHAQSAATASANNSGSNNNNGFSPMLPPPQSLPQAAQMPMPMFGYNGPSNNSTSATSIPSTHLQALAMKMTAGINMCMPPGNNGHSLAQQQQRLQQQQQNRHQLYVTNAAMMSPSSNVGTSASNSSGSSSSSRGINHTIHSSGGMPTSPSLVVRNAPVLVEEMLSPKPGNGNGNNNDGPPADIPWDRLLADSELVVEKDRDLVPDALFVAMAQMKPCKLKQADRVGCYKSREIGFVGMCCMHCGGQPGFGRFFPNSIRSLAQTTTSQTILKHISTKCRFCPAHIREAVNELQRQQASKDSPNGSPHASNASGINGGRPRYGSRKIFFQRIWARLHKEDADGPSSTSSSSSSSSSITPTSSAPPSPKQLKPEPVAEAAPSPAPLAATTTPTKKRNRFESSSPCESIASHDYPEPLSAVTTDHDDSEAEDEPLRRLVRTKQPISSSIPLTADHVTKRQKILAL